MLARYRARCWTAGLLAESISRPPLLAGARGSAKTAKPCATPSLRPLRNVLRQRSARPSHFDDHDPSCHSWCGLTGLR